MYSSTAILHDTSLPNKCTAAHWPSAALSDLEWAWPTPPPKKKRKPPKWLKQKRCAASVRVEWWHFQIHSSDDDLIGGETKSLYLGRTNWYSGRTNWYSGRKNWYLGRKNSNLGREDSHLGRKNSYLGRENSYLGKKMFYLGRTNSHLGRTNSSFGTFLRA